jgi:hypothetical protein
MVVPARAQEAALPAQERLVMPRVPVARVLEPALVQRVMPRAARRVPAPVARAVQAPAVLRAAIRPRARSSRTT